MSIAEHVFFWTGWIVWVLAETLVILALAWAVFTLTRYFIKHKMLPRTLFDAAMLWLNLRNTTQAQAEAYTAHRLVGRLHDLVEDRPNFRAELIDEFKSQFDLPR